MTEESIIHNSRIVFIGGGGHCKSVLDSYVGNVDSPEIVITDARLRIGTEVLGYRVVGNDETLQTLFDDGCFQAVISLGSIKSTVGRRRIFEKTRRIGFSFPNIIDITSTISRATTLGKGVYIGKKAVINICTTIGDFVIINTGAIVEHDCIIGDFSHVSVGAVICGGCEIGEDVFVGANATVIQGVKIGNGSVIGAGSIVLDDVPQNTWIQGIWSNRLRSE